ncbi:MAG: rhomboid family intramembrane serine protease [bacterium]|nr:rhomboid family intramembrane serine protease [bacterium]
MLILPIGHESDTVRRIPWVTFIIMAICVLVHILSPSLDSFQVEYSEALNTAGLYYLEHPYLEVDEETDLRFFPNARQKEEALRQYASISKSKPSDDYTLMTQQEELDQLVDDIYYVLDQVPSRKWGFIPAKKSFVGLITHMFLHGGILHLVFNLLLLYLSAPFIEDVWGRSIFTMLYLVLGMLAGLMYAAHYPNFPGPLIGASGAIAGMMGAFLVRFFSTRIKFFYMLGFFIRGTFKAPAWLMLPLWLGFEFMDAKLMDSMFSAGGREGGGGVAHWAHIWGFVFGVVFALLIRFLKIEERFIAPKVEAETTFVNKSFKVYEEASQLIEEGKKEEAYAKLLEGVKADPTYRDNVDFLWNLGADMGKQQEASKYVIRLIENDARTAQFEPAVHFYLLLKEAVPDATIHIQSKIRILEGMGTVEKATQQEAAVLFEEIGNELNMGSPIGLFQDLCTAAFRVDVAFNLSLAAKAVKLTMRHPEMPDYKKKSLQDLLEENESKKGTIKAGGSAGSSDPKPGGAAKEGALGAGVAAGAVFGATMGRNMSPGQAGQGAPANAGQTGQASPFPGMAQPGQGVPSNAGVTDQASPFPGMAQPAPPPIPGQPGMPGMPGGQAQTPGNGGTGNMDMGMAFQFSSASANQEQPPSAPISPDLTPTVFSPAVFPDTASGQSVPPPFPGQVPGPAVPPPFPGQVPGQSVPPPFPGSQVPAPPAPAFPPAMEPPQVQLDFSNMDGEPRKMGNNQSESFQIGNNQADGTPGLPGDFKLELDFKDSLPGPAASKTDVPPMPPTMGKPEPPPAMGDFAQMGRPDTGTPQPGPPNTGLPDTGLPNTGLPNTGLPDTGLPNTGLPNIGLPDTGLPGGMIPEPTEKEDSGVFDHGLYSNESAGDALLDHEYSAQEQSPADALLAHENSAHQYTAADALLDHENTASDVSPADVLMGLDVGPSPSGPDSDDPFAFRLGDDPADAVSAYSAPKDSPGEADIFHPAHHEPKPPSGDDLSNTGAAPATPKPPQANDPFNMGGMPAPPAPPPAGKPFNTGAAPAAPKPPQVNDPFNMGGMPAPPAPPSGGDPFSLGAVPVPPQPPAQQVRKPASNTERVQQQAPISRPAPAGQINPAAAGVGKPPQKATPPTAQVPAKAARKITATTAVPVAIKGDKATLDIPNVGHRSLGLDKITAVTVAKIKDKHSYLLIDLFMDDPNSGKPTLRSVRFLSNQFNPRKFVPGVENLVEAYRIFISVIMRVSNAAPYPDVETVELKKLKAFPTIEAYEASF